MSKVFNPSGLDKYIKKLQDYGNKGSSFTVEIRNVDPDSILNSHSKIGTYLLDKFRTINGEHYPIFAYLVSKGDSASLILSCADTVNFQLYLGSRRMGGGQKSVNSPPSSKMQVSVPSAYATNFMSWSQTNEDDEIDALIEDFLDEEFRHQENILYQEFLDEDTDDVEKMVYSEYNDADYEEETEFSVIIDGKIVMHNQPIILHVPRNSQKVAQCRYESTSIGCTNPSCHFEHQNPRPSKKDHVMCRFISKQGGCTNPSCRYQH